MLDHQSRSLFWGLYYLIPWVLLYCYCMNQMNCMMKGSRSRKNLPWKIVETCSRAFRGLFLDKRRTLQMAWFFNTTTGAQNMFCSIRRNLILKIRNSRTTRYLNVLTKMEGLLIYVFGTTSLCFRITIKCSFNFNTLLSLTYVAVSSTSIWIYCVSLQYHLYKI